MWNVPRERGTLLEVVDSVWWDEKLFVWALWYLASPSLLTNGVTTSPLLRHEPQSFILGPAGTWIIQGLPPSASMTTNTFPLPPHPLWSSLFLSDRLFLIVSLPSLMCLPRSQIALSPFSPPLLSLPGTAGFFSDVVGFHFYKNSHTHRCTHAHMARWLCNVLAVPAELPVRSLMQKKT